MWRFRGLVATTCGERIRLSDLTHEGTMATKGTKEAGGRKDPERKPH